MKVAITIWENRISPVFDSSQMLLIAEIENAKIIDKKLVTFNPEMPSYLIESLNRMDIGVLICGAVSEMPANLIEAGGIKLIPFVAGYTDDVLISYAKDATIRSTFLMPGCGRNHPIKRQGSRKGQKKKKKGNRDGRQPIVQVMVNELGTISEIDQDH